MAVSLSGFQVELKCPICLDELSDPVTMECGHNFCHTCIQHSLKNLQGSFPCPTCRHSCQDPNLRSNIQLGRMIERTKQLYSISGKRKRQEPRTTCVKHKQDLTLFCEEDLELLCELCTGPDGHCGHQVMPIAKAAAHHREKIQGFIKPLKRKVKEAQKLVSIQSRRPLALREEVEARRQELAAEFERLDWFLDKEQQTALSRLAQEEKEGEKKLRENTRAFANYGSTLKGLLSQVVRHRALSEGELLSEVKNFYKNSDSLISPHIFSVYLQQEAYYLPPQYSALQKLIEKFSEDIILDPETAHPNLVISEDKKCVKFSKRKRRVSDSKNRFTNSPVVLGTSNFLSGRHFWVVQVGRKGEWAVGACVAHLSPRARKSSIPQGCWRIVWQGEGCESPDVDSDAMLQAVRAGFIGIFLDYELGVISFYSMPEKSHICTHRGVFFGFLCPYFYVGPDSGPLRICPGIDSE
ncbi:putative tripartite motif-containing protein 75 [Nannospalax galili]|uniref:putative tripartite motif-containing protein 75 n=1 Tax=Nannospalax galili TaxID=1026970 RepID=UPI0004ED3D2B|nr:putative tripartite motif-containing protein 75 [Nannospalax galili]